MDRRKFLKNSALAGAAALGVNQISPHLLPEAPAFAENHSHWAAIQTEINPPLKQGLEVDFAILGGGFTGLSTAFYLRKKFPAKTVAVLEAKHCGNGASGRNGAMVLNLTADRYMEFSSDPAMDKKIYDLTVENIERLRQLTADTGIDCELDTNGALQVFNTEDDLKTGVRYVEKARSLGMPFELWTKEQVREALGTEVYAGALLDPRAGQVHPMKLVAAWKAAAQTAGATIYEETPVVKVQSGQAHSIEVASGHVVRARALVMATNAYSSKLVFFRNRITPIFQYVGMTAPLDEKALNDLGWKSRLPFDDSRTLVYYLGLTRDNRIHIGGGRADYSFNAGLADGNHGRLGYAQLREELARIFPKLSGIEFESTWSGVVDMTLDFAPTVGKMGENIYYGMGYCGHGVNLTSLFGRIIADLAAGEGDRWRDLPFMNHHPPYVPNEPFRWLSVEALLAWYRVAG